MTDFKYKQPNCYIYLYHTDDYFILPSYPASLTDTFQSTFSKENPLSRTAPIYSYSNSSAGATTITLNLHRDMMNDVNKDNVSIRIHDPSDPNKIITKIDDDYIDLLIRKLQSIALPKYRDANKEVDPPRIAIQLCNQFFRKGVVNGAVQVTYGLPMMANGKYARCDISFSIEETSPYDADSISKLGSFRGLTSGLLNRMKNGDLGV